MEQIKKYHTLPIGYVRTDDKPLEDYTLFTSMALAEDYVRNNPIAYAGQIITILNGDNPKLYLISGSRKLNNLNLKEFSNRVDQYKQEFENCNEIAVLHNLGYRPGVIVLDQDGFEVETLLEYPTENQVNVRWNNIISGICYLV